MMSYLPTVEIHGTVQSQKILCYAWSVIGADGVKTVLYVNIVLNA